MKPVDIIGNLIYRDSYPYDLSFILQDTIKMFCSSHKLNTGLERDGGLSSSSDPDAPHNWPSVKPFLNWVDGVSWQIWQEWNYPIEHPRILSGSWVNKHPPGAWTDEHQHGQVPMVIVFYIDKPNDSGNLEIANPLYYHWSGTLKPNIEWIEVPVKTGDVIIFPGWVKHRTQKNRSSEDRYVMSINVGK